MCFRDPIPVIVLSQSFVLKYFVAVGFIAILVSVGSEQTVLYIYLSRRP